MTVNWRELGKAEKVELVKAAWKRNWSASKIAAALSSTLGGVRLSRNVVVGVYDRHPELRRSHPLGGSGAAKQRAHAEKRAKLTQDEREAKAREREVKKQEREEKARCKEEFQASKIYLVPGAPRPPTKLEIRETAMAYDEASRRVPLMELERGDCRWPVNDPEPKVEEYLFCGHKAKLGSRYCPHHAKRAVIPTKLQSIANRRQLRKWNRENQEEDTE